MLHDNFDIVFPTLHKILIIKSLCFYSNNWSIKPFS